MQVTTLFDIFILLLSSSNCLLLIIKQKFSLIVYTFAEK